MINRSTAIPRNHFNVWIVTLMLVLGASDVWSQDRPPNIVLILADDLGWTDLGCYGNTFNETPNIDRLAAQGMRFTNFYSMAVCSPTRASLQSGQTAARVGITVHIPGHWKPFAKMVEPPVALQLPREIVTFAERLRDAGYQTGYFGKWHLGDAGYSPGDQGWQTVVEAKGNTVPPGLARGSDTRRTAEFLTDRAIEFMESNREKPFVVQLAHFAVHIPLSTTPELLKKYEAKRPMSGYPSRPEYAGLLEELDQSVGRVMQTLDRLGLAENTLLVFVSDNGGLVKEQSGTVTTSNAPLRGEKGSLYEGGIRVPCIVRWPGVTRANVTCGIPGVAADFYATFLTAANLRAAEDQPLDGVDLSPVLRDPTASLDREALYWHLPHYHHSSPASAVRAGDWKLIEFFEDGSLELYNLRDDLGESRNLASQHPEVANKLRTMLREWRHEVQAQLPRDNPGYDPARADEFWSRKTIGPTGPPGSRGEAKVKQRKQRQE